MKLEGSLDAFSLPDVFALLAMTKKTGALRLTRDGARGVVFLTAGLLTGGSPQEFRQTLARRLIGADCVTDEALAAAVESTLADPNVGVARALQESAAIDDKLLHGLVTEHVRDTVFDLMRWPDGEFSFAVDEPNPDDVGVAVPADDVVVEVRRRLEQWAAVTAAIPSPQTVLALAPPDDETALTREEWAVLGLVDGRRTVSDLVAVAGRGEYAVVSLLAGLVERGLLRTSVEDGVAVLLRRHALVEPLEDDRAVLVPRSSQPSDADRIDAAPEPAPAEDTDDTEDSLADVVAVRQSVSGAVTPARPEPFIPPRRPEHPEDVSALTHRVEGTAAVAPHAVAYIERDPTVNKSLLLRLIAGVRGL